MKCSISILLFAFVFSCSDQQSEFEFPESWYTIPVTMKNYSDSDSCAFVNVIVNSDHYSIRRQNPCNKQASKHLNEKDRGYIEILYQDEDLQDVHIYIMNIKDDYKAFIYTSNQLNNDRSEDDVIYTTVESNEFTQYKSGIAIQHLKVDEIILDFKYDFVDRSFFDYINLISR